MWFTIYFTVWTWIAVYSCSLETLVLWKCIFGQYYYSCACLLISFRLPLKHQEASRSFNTYNNKKTHLKHENNLTLNPEEIKNNLRVAMSALKSTDENMWRLQIWNINWQHVPRVYQIHYLNPTGDNRGKAFSLNLSYAAVRDVYTAKLEIRSKTDSLTRRPHEKLHVAFIIRR